MTVKKSNWPFQIWLELAVRVYGLSPQQFWQMSLSDWLSLLSQSTQRASMRPLKRGALSDLINQFPDKEET